MSSTRRDAEDLAKDTPEVHAEENREAHALGNAIPEGPETAKGREPRPATDASEPSFGELIAKITAQFSALVRDELRYATVQAQAKVKKLGIGGGMFAVAGVLALYMLGLLLLAAVAGFANLVPWWAAFLIVSGILLLIIIILALIGLNRMKSAKKNKVDPKSGIEKDINAVKKGLGK